MRSLALWLLLLGVFATTLPIDAFRGSDYGADEARYLLVAESIVSDRDIDLTDEYRRREYADWYPGALSPDGQPIKGRLHDPHGFGFALLIAPAYALGGPTGVQLFLAAIAALGFVLAVRLARRVVPDPWATAGVLLVALSPPALAYAATVHPELAAGTLLAGAALCALRAREQSLMRHAYGGAAMLALLPWLGPKYVLAGLPLALLLVRWTRRRGRATVAIVAAEIMIGSGVFYVALNEGLYEGPTPGGGTGASFPGGYVDRVPRLASLWLDRDDGIVRWAPILALAFFAAWLLWRSLRERVARAIPERRDAEAAAALALLVCAATVAVAAFGAPTLSGDWFGGRHLAAALPAAAALCAWGLRHAPRVGAALGGLTLLASGWLLVDLWTGAADGWERPASRAPWGPLLDAFPRFEGDSAWAIAVGVALAVAVVALIAKEWLAHDLRRSAPAADRR